MDRWLTRVVALAVIALVVTIAVKSTPARTPLIVSAEADAAADAGAAHADASGFPAMGGDFAGVVLQDGGAAALSAEGGLLLGDMKDLGDADGGPSTLPSAAPRQVHVGVILVTFAGAQGAPATARAKPDARELVERLANDAKTDFHGAVQHGDSGSADDIGRVPRGILESATELAVFTLAPGTVSGVIETPRGFWIVKRID